MLGSLRKYLFEKEKRKRINLSSGRSPRYIKEKKNHFGILVDAGNPEDKRDVMALAERLRNDGHRVKILGFIEGRTEGLSIPFDIFTSAEMSKMTLIPKSDLVEAFISNPFDVLINTSIHKNYPGLDYISSLSKATFRIGPWYPQQHNNPYDLCLDAGSSATLREWIHELMHTLDKIY